MKGYLNFFRISRKLKNKSGETIAETLVTMVILSLAVLMLAGAVVSDRYAPGVARIHEGAWYDPDKGGEPGALCKYGNPNVLTIDIGTSQLAQATSAHTTLVEIEKYNGTVEQVTAFNGPVEMVAQCEYVPASQVKS